MSNEFLDSFQEQVDAEEQRVLLEKRKARAAELAQEVLRSQLIEKHQNGTFADILGDDAESATSFVELLNRNRCFKGTDTLVFQMPRTVMIRKGLLRRGYIEIERNSEEKVLGYNIGRRLHLPPASIEDSETLFLCQDGALKETCSHERKLIGEHMPYVSSLLARDVRPGEIGFGYTSVRTWSGGYSSSDLTQGQNVSISSESMFITRPLADILVDYATVAMRRH